jgi:hypothetical protein
MYYAAKLMMYAGAGSIITTLFAVVGIFLFRLAYVTYKDWDGMSWDERTDLIMFTVIFAGIYLLIAGLLIFVIFAASQTVFASA